VEQRLLAVVDHLALALARQELLGDIHQRVQAAMDKSQREYTLKEQLRIIREELGEAVGSGADADRFEARLREAGMPEELLS